MVMPGAFFDILAPASGAHRARPYPEEEPAIVKVEFSFEEFTELFRQVVKQLTVEERWQLLRELTREEDDKK